MKTRSQTYMISSRICRMFTTVVHTSSVLVLEPWFIVGFVDGEGS
jgi:hypothetical protein